MNGLHAFKTCEYVQIKNVTQPDGMMTICEIINERNETMRIDYWPDGKSEVKRSHGLSIMYMLVLQNLRKQGYNAIVAQRLTYNHMQTYKK